MNTSFIILYLFLGTLFLWDNVKAQNIRDTELKTKTSPLVSPLEYVTRLEPVSFEYNHEKFKHLRLPYGLQYGFIAEDVQQVLPGIVTTQSKMYNRGKNTYKTAGVKSIDMESIIPMLVGAVKEQQAEIEKLRAELQSIKASRNNK